jgi:hypothetical protein
VQASLNQQSKFIAISRQRRLPHRIDHGDVFDRRRVPLFNLPRRQADEDPAAE